MSGSELAALSRAHELFAGTTSGKWRWNARLPGTIRRIVGARCGTEYRWGTRALPVSSEL